MVQATYDIFNRQEIPDFILCNPSKEQLYSLKSASKKSVTRRFNSTSEVNIEVPKEVNGVDVPAYEYLQQRRLILVDDNESGYFVIVDSQEDSDGSVPKKTVKGLSIDFNLVKRRLSAFGGTYPLYDPITPLDSLLGKILEYIPSWSIGAVDSALLTKFRTFDVSDTNIYDFLVTDVEEAYNCIILFDTINKTISAKTFDNVTVDTDVFISHHNLIKTSSFKEVSDEISTALNVTGGGNLSINAVNPLGTNIIYNFDFYKDGDGWMTAGLISALNSWEALIFVSQPTYANTLRAVKTANSELVVLEGELTTLESEYTALEGVRLVQIEADPDADLDEINAELAAKQVQIDSKENEIDNKEAEIASLRAVLESINTNLSFESNFTVSQLEELDEFIVENSYQNENIIQLDSDTPDLVQEQAQILYDQGIEVLVRVSQPKYEFDIDAADMLSLKEFESVSDQLELGSIVHMQNASEQDLQLILLEIEYDYTSPEKFNLVFSNRLRLDNGSFLYSDLFGKAVKTGNKVSYDNYKWGDWEAYYKNDVTTFITSNLDASVNALINGDNEELLINENGLRLRKWDTDAGDYDPAQLWMSSKSLMFTEDNWSTASLGIGRITHDGSNVYGVVGGAIVGTILAGNELRIANDNNNFTLDETGATLIDASFTISNALNEIYLDPSNGILIRKNDGGTWVNTFSVDSEGDVVLAGKLKGASGDFSGKITASSGKIGAIAISATGLRVDSSHYIQTYTSGNSEIKWGGLHLKVNGDALFEGDIYAHKIVGEIDWGQIINVPLPEEKWDSTGNTPYSGNGIQGGTLTGAGGTQIRLDSYGVLTLKTDLSVRIQDSESAGFRVENGLGICDARRGLDIGNELYVGDSAGFGSYIDVSGRAYFNGGLSADGQAGLTFTVTATTPFGTRFLGFRDGLFVSYSS